MTGCLPVIRLVPPPIVLFLLRNGPIRAAGSARSPEYYTALSPPPQRRHPAAVLSLRRVKQSCYCCWRTRRALPVHPWPGSVKRSDGSLDVLLGSIPTEGENRNESAPSPPCEANELTFWQLAVRRWRHRGATPTTCWLAPFDSLAGAPPGGARVPQKYPSSLT